VNDAQHHRAHPDADRERHNRDHGEEGLLRKCSQTEAQILNEAIDEIACDRFAAFLFEFLGGTEFNSRPAFCFGRGQPKPLEIRNPELNMRAEFFAQLTLDLRPPKKSRSE
jgi:hypothetical protein